MIDERQEELASLYALDLLEGSERAEFEAALASNPELQRLTAELRSAAAHIAHTAPTVEPPAALKRRIESSIAARRGTTDNVVAFPRRGSFSVLSWGLAAGFAFATLWLGMRNFALRAENHRLADQQALAELTLKSAQTQLESERLVSMRIAADFNGLKASSDQQLAAAQASASNAEKQLADARAAQQTAESQLAQARKSEAGLVAQLTNAERAETAARAELTRLTDRMTSEGNLARLKIATLASMLHNSSQALAVAVWDPGEQQGIFTVNKLPANLPGQDYELWVIDEKPVSAGVFTVGPDGKAKVSFKPTAGIKQAVKFAVSREKDDGAKSHATPGEVIMISE
jgi:anti-sigma-K factor RskA